MKRHGADNGFTLIEVLAALLVFSLSIIGLSQAGTASTRNVIILEQKMLAGIVADNQLVEARKSTLRLGGQSGEETQMGQRFRWNVTTVETEVAEFYRLSVTVRAINDDQVLTQRSAFRKGQS